jgi:hypothetical protein
MTVCGSTLDAEAGQCWDLTRIRRARRAMCSWFWVCSNSAFQTGGDTGIRDNQTLFANTHRSAIMYSSSELNLFGSQPAFRIFDSEVAAARNKDITGSIILAEQLLCTFWDTKFEKQTSRCLFDAARCVLLANRLVPLQHIGRRVCHRCGSCCC